MLRGKPHIVVVGAGFGGIKICKLLAKEDVEVTLVDRHNFHLFQPLLYQVSTSVLSTDEIAYPTRSFFRKCPNVNFFMAKAKGVDQSRNVLLTNHGEIPYDYLVLAAGATTNFFGMKNVENHAYGMKTIQEAVAIRNHVLHEFERGDKPYRTAEDRKKRLTFVVVGGGPTGIEEAGAIAELINVQKKEFHHLDFSDVSIKLIEATSHVLPMMSQDLQDEAVRVLREKGVEVMLDTQVVDYDGNVLTLKSGEKIPTSTVIWAAGVKAVDFIKNCGGEYARDGRIWVEEDLLVKGAVNRNVFAIGDCAGFMHGGMKRPLPTVAPVATQGRLLQQYPEAHPGGRSAGEIRVQRPWRHGHHRAWQGSGQFPPNDRFSGMVCVDARPSDPTCGSPCESHRGHQVDVEPYFRHTVGTNHYQYQAGQREAFDSEGGGGAFR